MITQKLNEGLEPSEAVFQSLKRFEGAFALAILFAGRRDILIGARRGSPLAIGYGDGEMFLGSDALALAPMTQKISYLEDGDWCVLTKDSVEIFTEDGEKVERKINISAASGAMIGKGNYRHYMLKEIYEQPQVIGDTLNTVYNPNQMSIRITSYNVCYTKLLRACFSIQYLATNDA